MAVAKLQRGSSKVPAWQQQGSSVAVAKLQRGSSKVPAWQQQGSSVAVAKLQRGSSKVPAWQQQGSSVAVAKLQRGSSKVPAWQQQGSSTGFLTLFAIERYPISWYSGFPNIDAHSSIYWSNIPSCIALLQKALQWLKSPAIILR